MPDVHEMKKNSSLLKKNLLTILIQENLSIEISCRIKPINGSIFIKTIHRNIILNYGIIPKYYFDTSKVIAIKSFANPGNNI